MADKAHDVLLPVLSVAETKVAAARPLSAVQLAAGWSLLTGVVFMLSPVFAYALTYILNRYNVPCDPSSFVLRCLELTDAEAAEEGALWSGMVWCAAPQVAAAALALLLPSRRRRRARRALAYVALVAAVASHCVRVIAVRVLLVADPGYLFLRISSGTTIFMLAVGDLVCFLDLLLGCEE